MQVNYCIQSVEMPHYTHPDTPALNVLGTLFIYFWDVIQVINNKYFSISAELIGSSYLHTEIREKGGAYGSGC